MRRLFLCSALLFLTGCLAPTPLSPHAESGARLPANPPVATAIESGSTLDLGSPRAPLTLLLFTNHACEYCREAHDDLLPRLTTDFIQTNAVRLRVILLPITKYPQSLAEAKALFCAAAQGKAWPMHDALFSLPTHTAASLETAASALEMDRAAFDACLQSPAADAYAESQKTLSSRYQVTLVPTFILENERKVGLLSYADLRGWIRTIQQQKGITR